MKTYSSGLQRAGGREHGARRRPTGSKHGMFFIPPVPALLHSYPTLTHLGLGGGGDTPTPPPPTCTHTFQQHTRFYSWMKSINGSSERGARQWTRRPGQHANPGFPGLCCKKNIVRPSGCPKNKKTFICTKKKGMMGGKNKAGAGVT